LRLSTLTNYYKAIIDHLSHRLRFLHVQHGYYRKNTEQITPHLSQRETVSELTVGMSAKRRLCNLDLWTHHLQNRI